MKYLRSPECAIDRTVENIFIKKIGVHGVS